MKNTVIGTGYVGLVSGVCFSDFGHDVVCVDKDSTKIDKLERGEVALADLLKLSFVQGIYEVEGDLLRPLDQQADFQLHEDFVFGSKFKGKTNERLTQMLINLGIAAMGANQDDDITLLDPMCGRATTLFWALRYGINSSGLERDTEAFADVQRNLRKWTKLHRQKHKMQDGFVSKKNKHGTGKFLDFSAEDTAMKFVVSDGREADQIFKNQKFDLIVSDLPYGVQHTTGDGTRNPLAVVSEGIGVWKRCLSNRGVMVLAFNANHPKRDKMVGAIEEHGLTVDPFSCPHRMSESIVRDVLIVR